jgi:two-component system cell cycle sensor histidine kinase/response regulator CckA
VSAPVPAATVLLVDDEEDVRDLAREILHAAGYVVLEAVNGAQAVTLSESHPGPIHVLVTDMVMPGMSGQALAQRLATLRPDLRVLFMSGYASGIKAPDALAGLPAAFLPKPFSPDELAEKVRDLVEATPRPSI